MSARDEAAGGVGLQVSDELAERVAWAICVAGGDDDPERMTYIFDDGIQQPYGPAWTRYLPQAIAAVREVWRSPSPRDQASSVMLGALEKIAKQELSLDMSVDDQLGGDFEGAYNHLIELARKALASIETEENG